MAPGERRGIETKSTNKAPGGGQIKGRCGLLEKRKQGKGRVRGGGQDGGEGGRGNEVPMSSPPAELLALYYWAIVIPGRGFWGREGSWRWGGGGVDAGRLARGREGEKAAEAGGGCRAAREGKEEAGERGGEGGTRWPPVSP